MLEEEIRGAHRRVRRDRGNAQSRALGPMGQVENRTGIQSQGPITEVN